MAASKSVTVYRWGN